MFSFRQSTLLGPGRDKGISIERCGNIKSRRLYRPKEIVPCTTRRLHNRQSLDDGRSQYAAAWRLLAAST